jgi:hypothetical protein
LFPNFQESNRKRSFVAIETIISWDAITENVTEAAKLPDNLRTCVVAPGVSACDKLVDLHLPDARRKHPTVPPINAMIASPYSDFHFGDRDEGNRTQGVMERAGPAMA